MLYSWVMKRFNNEIVYLLDKDGTVSKVWAKRNPFGLSCKHHGIWDVLLLPDGKFRGGASYLMGWKKEGDE